MRTIDVRDLGGETSELLKQLREEGEMVEVTDEGQVFARIIPVVETPVPKPSPKEWESRADALAERIGKLWPPGVSAVEAVREQRREL